MLWIGADRRHRAAGSESAHGPAVLTALAGLRRSQGCLLCVRPGQGALAAETRLVRTEPVSLKAHTSPRQSPSKSIRQSSNRFTATGATSCWTRRFQCPSRRASRRPWSARTCTAILPYAACSVMCGMSAIESAHCGSSMVYVGNTRGKGSAMPVRPAWMSMVGPPRCQRWRRL
jgi:hypothetical protein